MSKSYIKKSKIDSGDVSPSITDDINKIFAALSPLFIYVEFGPDTVKGYTKNDNEFEIKVK